MQDSKAELSSLLQQFKYGLARSQAPMSPQVAAPPEDDTDILALIRQTEQSQAARQTDQMLAEIRRLLADWQAKRAG